MQIFKETAANQSAEVHSLGRENKVIVILKTGRFENIDSAVIISSICAHD